MQLITVVIESFSSSRSENGSVLYNISATEGLPRPNASPFELNGHCQVLLGLVDGTRLMSAPPESEVAERGEPSNLGPIERQFHARFADSPGLVVRKIVILDASLDPPADGTLFVSDVRDADAVRTALIEVSALLLYGLTKLANEWKDRAIATLLSSTSLFGSSPIREGIDDAPHSSLQSSDGATTPASSSSTPAPSSTEPQAQVRPEACDIHGESSASCMTNDPLGPGVAGTLPDCSRNAQASKWDVVRCSAVFIRWRCGGEQ